MRRCLHCSEEIETHELADAVRYGSVLVAHGHCHRLDQLDQRFSAVQEDVAAVADKVNGIGLTLAVRKFLGRI